MKYNTGYKGYGRLRQRNAITGELTGVTKENDPSDADYIAPTYDPKYCEPGDWYIDLDRYSQTVDYTIGSVVVQVSSNTEWDIVLRSPYLSTDLGDEGIHDGQAVVGYTENTGGDRTLRFDIRSKDGSIVRTFEIFQQAELNLNPVLIAMSSSGDNACSNYNNMFYVTRYVDGLNFDAATKLYKDESGTFANAGWYSDGIIFKYWNGTSFGFNGYCKLTAF